MPSGFPDRTKVNPLSAFALDELRRIAREPVPEQAVNHGVVNRLILENLVKRVQFLEATDAGKARAAAPGPRPVT